MRACGSAWASATAIASGAGADIGNANGLVVWQPGERGFDEVLGFWTRDEDGRRDAKRERVELLLSDDVLDRLVTGATGDFFPIVAEIRDRDRFGTWMGQQPCPVLCRGFA